MSKTKKKGFTIVELLAVIVVLAIIIAIAVPAYGKIQKNIQAKQYKNKLSLIKTAAEKYADDTNYVAFYIDDLVKNGYIDGDTKDIVMNNLKDEYMNCYPIIIKDDGEQIYAQIEEKTETTKESYDTNGACDRNALVKYNNYFNI